MATISGCNLGLSGQMWADVTLTVSYVLTLTPLELYLAEHGLGFEERVQLVGDDEGTSTDVVLHTFQSQLLPVAPGQATYVRTRQVTVRGGTLNEDPATPGWSGGGWGGWAPAVPQPDELVAHVEVVYVGMGALTTSAHSPVLTVHAF